jgi:hypothetical protein
MPTEKDDDRDQGAYIARCHTGRFRSPDAGANQNDAKASASSSLMTNSLFSRVMAKTS